MEWNGRKSPWDGTCWHTGAHDHPPRTNDWFRQLPPSNHEATLEEAAHIPPPFSRSSNQPEIDRRKLKISPKIHAFR